MKKITFFRTLLVAAALLGGSNAWADTTTLYERGTTNAWASSDVGDGAWSGGTAVVGTGLEVTNGVASSITISPSSDSSILTWTATWNPGNATGTANNTNAYITFGDVTFAFYGSSWASKVTIGSTTTQLSGVGATRSRDYTISVTINQITNAVSYSFTDNGTTVEGTGTTAMSGSFTTLTHGLGGKSPSWTNTATLKAVEITETPQSATTVDYTVKFQDTDGTTIKEDVIYENTAIVGEVYQATTSDLETFYNDGGTKKYVYKSGQNTETVATSTASENVVTLVFDTYEKYTYSLKYKLGDADAVEQTTATIWGDETATIYYPICRQDASDNYYVVEKNASTPYFGVTFTSSKTDATISYILDEDIVYYAESENMGGSRYGTGYNGSYSSNGSSYCAANSDGSYIATNWSVDAGYYNIEVGMTGRYAVSVTPKLMTSSNDESPTVLSAASVTASTSLTQQTYSNQLIAADQNLYIFNDNSPYASKWALDYVILRNANLTVSTTITSAGFATLYTPYALDFSGVSGLTAYTATVSDNTVTLTAVDDVPANTGVVLKGAANTYSIPVIASSSTEQGSLTGSATTDLAYEDFDSGYTYYILTKDGDADAQFNPVNEGTITAGKAYLKIADGGSGAKLRVVFADDATAIKTIAVDAAESAAIYNLSGQRVNAAYKGIVIKNGKKYLNK